LKTFEDCIDIIDREIAKRRQRWTLKAIPSIDFQDVSQILRIHIWKKWDQYNQTLPLEPWLNKILTNQITNLIRNLYGNFARPCITCPANQGGTPPDGLCAIYIKQCSACPLFAYWERHKKSAYDTKLPLPLESHSQEVYNMPESSFDITKQVSMLHKRLKEQLTPMQFKVYQYLYVEGKTDEEVAKLMHYKTTEKGRDAGYRQIPNMKKAIIAKAKKIIEKEL
jgi:DNA-directed RNA polymerase specialized sigma24 family protein